jgi:hypothetical protein
VTQRFKTGRKKNVGNHIPKEEQIPVGHIAFMLMIDGEEYWYTDGEMAITAFEGLDRAMLFVKKGGNLSRIR